jgi:uncharacterized lipoprotein NlpE involved in copper resistance
MKKVLITMMALAMLAPVGTTWAQGGAKKGKDATAASAPASAAASSTAAPEAKAEKKTAKKKAGKKKGTKPEEKAAGNS